MNFGYLIVVSSNKECDYAKMAYALAISIKTTQKAGYDKIALVIDDPMKVKNYNSRWVFDKIISWDEQTYWDGRSWMDKLSPWETTICLDADMLFTRDYSHWVDYFINNCELYVANKAYTYRNDLVVSDYYRKTFEKNNLPNLYSFFTYFKKNSDLANQFFDLGRYIIKNSEEFSNLYLNDYKPKVVGTDEAFALSAKILGIEDQIAYPLDFPKVVHMKGMAQSWPWAADKVSDYAGFYVNKRPEIKIGSYLQSSIVHYVEKDKMTDEVISILEERLWNKAPTF